MNYCPWSTLGMLITVRSFWGRFYKFLFTVMLILCVLLMVLSASLRDRQFVSVQYNSNLHDDILYDGFYLLYSFIISRGQCSQHHSHLLAILKLKFFIAWIISPWCEMYIFRIWSRLLPWVVYASKRSKQG